jgi:hypothetical protein
MNEVKIKEIELLHDYLKHLTTLSTGSILLIVAFLEKLFPDPVWKFLVAIALLGFTIVIILSLLLQFFILVEMDPDTPSYERVAQICFFTLAASFVIGIGSVVLFAFKNLF